MVRYIFFSLLLFCNHLFADDKYTLANPQNVIRTYPLHLIGGEYTLGYERFLDERRSMELIGGYYRSDFLSSRFFGSNFLPVTARGFSIRYAFKKSFRNHTIEHGWQHQYRLMFKRTVSEDVVLSEAAIALPPSIYLHNNIDVTKTVLGFQYFVGHNWLMHHGIVLGMHFGGGLRFIQEYTKYNAIRDDYNGVAIFENRYEVYRMLMPTIHFGLNIGIAW